MDTASLATDPSVARDWTHDGYPAFFAQAPRVRVRDPLAAFLGACRHGEIDYGYADAVRLAGHSCPTVASAYLLARAGLAALYPGTLPVRGGMRVEMRDAADAGVTGVVAAVMTLLTGAATDAGFAGIAGRFGRRDLLSFGHGIEAQVRLVRVDTGEAVLLHARLDRVPADPRVTGLLQRCLHEGGEDACASFGALWQDRVRRLLLDHADDPDVIVVRRDSA